MLQTTTHTIAKLFNTSCEDVDFSGVSIDSRKCNNMLFVAIVGERLDGHNFIEDAIKNGCVAVVASQKHNFNIPTIYVDDTTIALGKIAKYHREKVNPKIIAITGSNGKTTTKNMLSNIFSKVAPTLKTTGNLNNHIGVPLTLLNLEPHHKFAIIEMGANHLGEIKYLRNIAEPDVACVINTLDAHIGEFGGKANLIQAKCEIFSSRSINVVNANINFNGDISFGKGGDIDYTYLDHIHLQLLGKHNKENALAAVAIAKSLTIDDSIIAQGLEQTTAEHGRLELITTPTLQIINDCYNASPSAMKFALKTLAEFDGTTIAVLGDMAELGDKSSEIHAKIGEYARNMNIDYIYSIGELAQHYGGIHFDTMAELTQTLQRHTHATLLLKASRSAKFEVILQELIKDHLKLY
jgi:UDP-N-acetylmuramoyl-tripeptide--D-alanyl-D-alanine ligase